VTTSFNEKWLRDQGFLPDGNGGWSKPGRNHNTRTAPVVERASVNAALEPAQIKKRNSKRFLVRVTSFRRRLLDEDNLAEKYHVDCCRYAGLIYQDCPGQAKIEVSQQKVGQKEPEFVKVEIIDLP
jgi:hypothetical protein